MTTEAERREREKGIVVRESDVPKIGKPREFVPFPENFNDAMKLCQIIAESEMVPKEFRGKPANVLISVGHGVSIGLGVMQSVQSVKVINGQPSVWGDTALALVRASGQLEEWDEWLTSDGVRIGDDVNILKLVEAKKDVVGHCRSKRPGMKAQEHCFSVDDARIAGLWGKDSWRTYPKRMLKMRSRGFNLRDGFSDVLKGLNVIEAAWDTPPEETVVAGEIAGKSQPETKGAEILEKVKAVEQFPKEEVLRQIADSAPPPDLIVEEGGKEQSLSEVDLDIRNAEAILKNSVTGAEYLAEVRRELNIRGGDELLESYRPFYLKQLLQRIDRMNDPQA